MNPRFLKPVMVMTAMSTTSVTLTGQVVEYTNFAQWQAAAGSFTTITFTGHPQFTIITNQYESLGAVFTDGNDFIHLSSSFPIDDAGLSGNFDSPISIAFTTPQTAVAVHHPGLVQMTLSLNGDVFHTSSIMGGGGANFFAGIVLQQPFDAIVITDPLDNQVFIDNLYFAPGIPAPGALALLGAAAVLQRRREKGV